MAINNEDTRYGLDVYDVHRDLGQRVHEDVSAYRNEQTVVSYESSPGARRKSKKLPSLFSLQRVATRSLSIQQSAQLTRACSIKYGETVNVHFGIGEKLIIMFMYNNMHAVYRKSDGTVAVLTDAQFQRNPPAMLDGSKYGNLLSDVEFVLMYAVAKTDHSVDKGLKFRHNDVILILAECRDTFVGITSRKRVGIFPSKLVHIITKRRMCIFNGMFLRMTVNSNVLPEGDYGNSTQHDDTTVYEITKSSNGVFSWVTQDGYEISFHALIEKALTPENSQNNDDTFYETIHEVSYCGTTLQEKKRMPLPQPSEGKDSNSLAKGDSSLQGEIWFHGNLSREQAEKVLEEDGDFLVRFMSNFPWVYVLSCKTKTGYEHFRLRLNNQSYYHTNGGDFRSIRNLIQVHQSEDIPVSKDPSTIIRRAVHNTIHKESLLQEDNQGYTYEVHDIYDDISSDIEFRSEAEVKESVQPPEVPPSKSGASSDIILESTSSDTESSGEEPEYLVQDEVLPTEPKDESADGPGEKSANECSPSSIDNDPKYILEMKTIKEEISGLKSLLQSFLMMGVHPENIKQDKSPLEGSNLSESTGNTDEKEETKNESPEEELPKTVTRDPSEEQVTQESRTDADLYGRQESQTTNAVEMAKLVEEMNYLKSCLETLEARNATFQPQILETYQHNKENVQYVKEKTQKATDTSGQEETYVDNVVEYEEEKPIKQDFVQEMQESAQRRKHLKRELQPYWQMEINDQLRDIVAMYLEPEFFHDVGKKLGVHKNRRTQIERDRTDIVQRTYELLGQWHQRHGHVATIGKLIESLEPFNPEDFNTILEEVWEEVNDNYSTFT